jgi:hypothetical protein
MIINFIEMKPVHLDCIVRASVLIGRLPLRKLRDWLQVPRDGHDS